MSDRAIFAVLMTALIIVAISLQTQLDDVKNRCESLDERVLHLELR